MLNIIWINVMLCIYCCVVDNDIECIWYLYLVLTGEYTFARMNGDLIDGTPCDKIHGVLRNNPLCLGYCINHPPMGDIPNLLPIDVGYTFDKENMKHRPTWHRDKQVIDPFITVFLAMRDIKVGDELFFDYELDGLDTEETKDKLPEWYHSIDANVYDGNL